MVSDHGCVSFCFGREKSSRPFASNAKITGGNQTLLLPTDRFRYPYIQDDDDDDDGKDAPRTDRVRRGSLYIVLEYLEHDLAGLLDLNIA